MAELFFPMTGFPAYEDEWRLLWRTLATSGVVAGYLNALAVSADGSGMNVKVASGAGLIDGFYYQSDAVKTLTIAAAHATLPRIDTAVLRINRTVTPRTYTSAVVTGSANASPVAPTLTQTATLYEMPLADVRVDAAVGTITAGKVTDRRPSMAPLLPPASIVTSLLASGAVTTAILAANVLSADATGRGKMQDGYLSADATGRAKVADGFVNAAKLETTVPGRTLAKLWAWGPTI